MAKSYRPVKRPVKRKGHKMSRYIYLAIFIITLPFFFSERADASNLPPIPGINYDNTPGSQSVCVGTSVYFDGSYSYDQDEYGESIVEWEWDILEWDGYDFDTLYDVKTAYSAGTNYTFSDPGDYLIRLWVKDDENTWNDIGDIPYVYISVVKVDHLEYDDPVNGWTSIVRPIYVYKGTTVNFKAIPNPSGFSWPSGKPVWGGTSGASGTGSTKSVTFNTLSTGTYDYKTVTAECGNTKTAQVIVYDFDGEMTPNDMFYERSMSQYGIEETVALSHTTDPTGITGLPLEWEKYSGVGSVSGSTYDAEAIAGAVTLRLELQSGPSAGHGKNYDKTVVAPTYRFARSRFETGIYHIYHQHGIMFKGEYFVDPKNVSFTNIEVREGTSTPAVGTGYFEPVNGDVHTPDSWFAPAYPNIEWGCWWGADTTGFQGDDSDYIGQSGTFTNYYIDIEYRGDDNVERSMSTIESTMRLDTVGYSEVKKGLVG